MKFRLPLTCLLLGLIGAARGADPSYGVVVSPDASLLRRDGNDLGTILAGDGFRGRVQQVYDASFFSFLPSGGGWIDSVSFRGDRTTAENRIYRGDGIQVQLSTTRTQTDALSPVFASNVGEDAKTVIAKETAVVIANGRGPDPTDPFATAFVFFDKPFLFDPSKGNLLVDIRFFKDVLASTYDAETVMGDSVSSVSAFSLNTGQVPTVGTPTTLGFVTAFTYHPVPEPSALVLGALGLGLALTRRRKAPSPL